MKTKWYHNQRNVALFAIAAFVVLLIGAVSYFGIGYRLKAGLMNADAGYSGSCTVSQQISLVSQVVCPIDPGNLAKECLDKQKKECEAAGGVFEASPATTTCSNSFLPIWTVTTTAQFTCSINSTATVRPTPTPSPLKAPTPTPKPTPTPTPTVRPTPTPSPTKTPMSTPALRPTNPPPPSPSNFFYK